MSIINLLLSREIISSSYKNTLDNLLEDSFLNDSSCSSNYKDSQLASTVSSTIAIAVSPDGLTFCSTHGDHTIKVFLFFTGYKSYIHYHITE